MLRINIGQWKRPALVLMIAALSAAGCTKDLETINKNPNSPENINSDYLMSDVLLKTAYSYQTDAFNGRQSEAGRYITLVQNTGYDLFAWGPVGWNDIYSRLSANEELYRQAAANGEDQYLAIAKIMKAFNFSYLTDLYGNVPYKEALLSKATGITQPVYDDQKDIYPSLLQLLEEANTLLSKNTGVITAGQDVLFAGNVLKWRKFANTLRLRMLLRISKTYPAAFTEMQSIVGNKGKYPLMENNSDNAEVVYRDELGNTWPGSTLAMIEFDFNKTKASSELVSRLLQLKDPRLPVWVAPVATITGGTVDNNLYVGVPNAVSTPTAYNGGEGHQSRLSLTFRAAKGDMLKASLVSYTELCFILSEVVQSGKVTVNGKTAEQLYLDGIRSSMTFYGVAAKADSELYYDQPTVKYNGTLQQLITQKWIAMIFRGSEGWFDHRRTGFPAFTVGPLAIKTTVPLRFRYPDTESAYNLANYKKGVSAFGADDEYTPMWYLK